MILNLSTRKTSDFWLEQNVISLSSNHQERWLGFVDLARSESYSSEDRLELLREFVKSVFLNEIDEEYEFNAVLLCTEIPWFIPEQIIFWQKNYKTIFFPVGDALVKPKV